MQKYINFGFDMVQKFKVKLWVLQFDRKILNKVCYQLDGYQENVFEIKYTKINNALILHLMYSIDFK